MTRWVELPNHYALKNYWDHEDQWFTVRVGTETRRLFLDIDSPDAWAIRTTPFGPQQARILIAHLEEGIRRIEKGEQQ